MSEQTTHHPSNLLLKDYACGRLSNKIAIDTVKRHLPCQQCEGVMAEAERVDELEHRGNWFTRLFGRNKA